MSVAVTVQSVPITVTVQDQSPIVVSISAVGTPGPAGPGVPVGGTTGQSLIKTSNADYATTWGNPTASVAWGGITGTLSNQTDLQTALNNQNNLAIAYAIALGPV